VAGVDPHKLSVTIAVVDPAGVEIDAASFDNTHAGRAAGEEWLAGLEVDILRIGVEGSSGHGRHLAKRLVAAGYDTREVPSRRTAERRRCRRRAKTDREDALALARATAGEPGWDRSSPAPASVTRTMSSSSYASIANCWSTGAPRCSITPRPRSPACPARSPTPCRRAAESIRGWPPSWRSTAGGSPGVRATVDLLAELPADIAELSERIRLLERRLGELVAACGSTLTEEAGIGVGGAATLLAEVGDPTRFRSESAFNRWWGGAPVAVSSGEGDGQPVRHWLDLLGSRAVNCMIHMMSVTQSRYHEPALLNLNRQRSAGHTKREARRAHKVQLGRRIIRRMWADRRRQLHEEQTERLPSQAA
jgi:hypothetical protein